MVQVTEIDMSGVGSLVKGIHNALIGTGSGGDLAKVVKDETRLLAEEIGKPPSNGQQHILEQRIRSDIGKVFITKPSKVFTGSQKGRGNVDWLYAGPGFLVGCPQDRMLAGKVSLSGGGGKQLFYLSRNRLPKQRFENMGRIKRGTQHAMFVNRFMVAKGAIKSLFKSLKSKVGRRDASFAETAKALGSKAIPAKSAQHFPTGKSILKQLGLTGPSPEIVFGSDAKGVAGLAGKVQKAVRTRENKMAQKLKLILSGYAKKNP